MSRGNIFTNCIKCVFALFASFLLFFLVGCSADEDVEPKLGTAKLTTPTISENGVLKVGVNTSQSPMAGMGNSKIIGIDVDVAAALADSLGLKLQIVDTGSTPAKALSNGTVDVVFGVESSDKPSGTQLTDQYIQTAVSFFKKTNDSSSSLTSAPAPKIAAQASSKSAWTVSNYYGDDSLVSASDLTGAFLSLSKGEAQFVAADAVIGLYAANKANIKVEIVGVDETSSGYCVAVAEKNTTLYSEISTALKKLVQDGTVETIEKKWLGDVVELNGISKVEKSASATSSSANSGNSIETASKSSSGTTATDANSVRGY